MLQCTMLDYTCDAIQVLVAHRPSESCTLTIYVADTELASVNKILETCKNFSKTDTLIVAEQYETIEYKGFVATSVKFENLNIEVSGDSDGTKRSQAFCVIQMSKK